MTADEIRERLIDVLAKSYKFSRNECRKHCLCDGCPAREFGAACNESLRADYLIAHGVTIQRWIPVAEPPKEKGTYLVCTENGGVLLGHWYGTAWNVGGGAKKHLAYWMEKPQTPKGE